MSTSRVFNAPLCSANDAIARTEFKSERARLSNKVLSIVVFGASGDLARKKTFPALFNLFITGLLPKSTIILGYGRSALEPAAFEKQISENFAANADPECRKAFLHQCVYFRGQYNSSDDVARMSKELG